jgi:ABC-type Fe3+ transport system permease subunit
MNTRIVFGLSALMSLMGSVAFARYYLWPNLRRKDLGAAFFIPTVVVPPLLVTYALIFNLLFRHER